MTTLKGENWLPLHPVVNPGLHIAGQTGVKRVKGRNVGNLGMHGPHTMLPVEIRRDAYSANFRGSNSAPLSQGQEALAGKVGDEVIVSEHKSPSHM